MRQSISRIFFALLTILFVSAMPLQAAYATADEGQTKEACQVTYEGGINAEVRATIKAQGGLIIELKGAEALDFLARVEKLVGQEAPFTIDAVAIIRPTEDVDGNLNVAYFNKGCLVNFGHLPAPLMFQLIPRS